MKLYLFLRKRLFSAKNSAGLFISVKVYYIYERLIASSITIGKFENRTNLTMRFVATKSIFSEKVLRNILFNCYHDILESRLKFKRFLWSTKRCNSGMNVSAKLGICDYRNLVSVTYSPKLVAAIRVDIRMLFKNSYLSLRVMLYCWCYWSGLRIGFLCAVSRPFQMRNVSGDESH